MVRQHLRRFVGTLACACVLVLVCDWAMADGPLPKCDDLVRTLKNYPSKVLWESYQDGNWDLWVMDADGSNKRNLTQTKDVDEMYPKASPDGTRIAFVIDEGQGAKRVRSIYLMDRDGSNRRKIVECGRQPCWSSDGKTIAYLKGIPGARTSVYTANKGLYFHDLQTGKHTPHINKDVKKMLCIGLTPDSKWFVASAIGGLGYGHSIIAFEAGGMKHCELVRAENKFWQCRPDISPRGRKIAFAKAQGEGPNKMLGIAVADLDFSSGMPRLRNERWVVDALDPIEVYHADWSPDGKYLLCSRGPKEKSKMKTAAYVIGIQAKGWDICVADANGYHKWHALTDNGMSNKEPEWLPPASDGQATLTK
ncbi:MAG: PD40 domain-containing protein [Phycisphaerae bacterium]|nr:PD40 domain-containing protein [Phycisphaerae bacterium]